MTVYKIAPLTWLNNKYSQINHNHELYEEKELEQIISVPYHSDENSYYDETSQEYIYYTVNSYIHENASSFKFSIENFDDMTGNDKFIVLEVDNGINIIIKEMNNNEVWLYTVDRDGSIYDTLTLGDECNYWEVFNKEVTISEPQTGISKDATIKINVNYNRAIFYVYENNVLSDTITIHFTDENYDYSFRNDIISLNYTGFTIKNNIKYYEPKILSTRNYTSDTISSLDLREFGKAIFNVSFNSNEHYFIIDGLCDIYYYDGYIYDNDTRDSENNPIPIKQGNEIMIETIIDGLNGGIIVNLTEGFVHRKGYEDNIYYYGNYESLTVTGIIDEVGNRAKKWEIDNLNNNMSYKEDKNNKITQWSNNPSDTKYPSEKLVKDSLDSKRFKTLNKINLLGKGNIDIDGGFDGGSTIIYQPILDGTENITTIATYTPTITDNTLTNGCGYLTNGWDNTIDWELTFDYYTTGDNNGYLVIPKGTTQRDYNGIQQWYCNQLNFYINGTKPTGYISNATSCNEWISVKITKIGYVWTVYYNGVQKTQFDTESYASTVDSWTEMCIGLDKNSSNRYATIKNIVVKTINGGSTTIFKDDCSVDNTSNYVNTIHIGSTSTNIGFSFDSSSNGYLFTGTGGEYFGGKVIPFDFQNNIIISCDTKILSTSAYNQCMIGITDSLNPSMSGNYDFFRIRGDNRCDYIQNNRDTSIKTGLSLVNNWVKLEVSIDGTSLIGKLYDENGTLLAQTSQIINTYLNPYIFIGLNCYGNNQKYVKNIVVKTNNTKLYLGDSIMNMINTVLEHIITNWEDYD